MSSCRWCSGNTTQWKTWGKHLWKFAPADSWYSACGSKNMWILFSSLIIYTFTCICLIWVVLFLSTMQRGSIIIWDCQWLSPPSSWRESQNRLLCPHCHMYVTAIQLTLHPNSLTVTSWIRCNVDGIDSGRNPCDKCDGGNSDMHPWRRCRGGMTGLDRAVYPVSRDSVSTLCVTFPQGHSLCERDTKPPVSL